jgi:CheY-like chemotaxis protein
VIPVASVREAIDIARETVPDLILSDLHMPDSDGFHFFETMRADPKLKSVPFAIISSTFWPESDLSRALRLGVRKFIQRPIDPRQLLAEVEACLAESPSE